MECVELQLFAALIVRVALIKAMMGSCVIRGDPRLETFDSGTLSKRVFSPLGEYWLVNNKHFKIQGPPAFSERTARLHSWKMKNYLF